MAEDEDRDEDKEKQLIARRDNHVPSAIPRFGRMKQLIASYIYMYCRSAEYDWPLTEEGGRLGNK